MYKGVQPKVPWTFLCLPRAMMMIHGYWNFWLVTGQFLDRNFQWCVDQNSPIKKFIELKTDTGKHQCLLRPKDSTIPFPWANVSKESTCDHGGTSACKALPVGKRHLESVVVSKGTRQKTHASCKYLTDYLDEYPQLRDLHQKLNQLYPGQVEFQLPRLHALSGAVVRHCSNFVEQLFNSQSPMTFKFGFTHSPLWRWGNSLYGYATSRDKWTTMVVIYIATEPHSAAMLEAALIDKYQSTFPECVRFK